MDAYFIHKTTGILEFDPKSGTKHFEPWWALLNCDDGIAEFYAWLLKGYGLVADTFKLWGTHVSVIKGQEPAIKAKWGSAQGRAVEYWYTNQIRWDNGKHAWLDVYSEEMSQIREEMGLSPKVRYHLTIGRLK
jgi:hypothetical protein